MSVLGDNKLLTLPNGERLNLPPNVRIMFEVEHLHYATLATVSRCVPLDANDEDAADIPGHRADALAADASDSANLATQNVIEYNLQHSDFPLAPERVEQYVTKRLFVSVYILADNSLLQSDSAHITGEHDNPNFSTYGYG
ncbi:hypothetical protein M405DRAFT_886331 [Rhizopogon salebrosus TDB-379]|nr:hypothetical protein M405DRAFT_886331 [Rhizopogon salebrosus TDB-379]